MRLIDADELKKDFHLNFGGVSHAVAACEIIDRQPTIDPKSQRLISRLILGRYGRIKCENCGYCVVIGGEDTYHNVRKVYNFCPHCGARMEVLKNADA